MPLETCNPGLSSVAHYDLVDKIAEGGMGTVYKGRHRQTGEVVAIKVVPPHLAANPVHLKRFEQEYNAARALDHPNVVKALEFGHDGASPYLVMEFVEGESIGQRLQRVGRIPEQEAVKIISQAAQALHRAHKLGLIHRDVKPDNILLTKDDKVKLADLGLVKELETDLNLTRTGRGLGTPHYMAPEQFRNAKNADVRCDIYSLAATLYHMVTGEMPFKACGPLDAWMKKIHNELAAPRELAADLTERIDWALRRAMSPDPDLRPASCREFIEDLTGQSTRKLSSAGMSGPTPSDLWYLVYKDDEGVVHTVKGSKAGIRRSLKEGLLGDADHIRISRTKTGVFDPLRYHAEFRDLVLELQPIAAPGLKKTPTPRKSLPKDPRRADLPELPLREEALAVSPPPKVVSTGLMPALAAASPNAPHFDIGPVARNSDWFKWLLLIAIALITAAMGYLLMPFLARHL